METAVLICEDGAFFRHGGFHEEAIRNSIRENVKMGRFVRGASTISMQLAKNLYLPREKTVSRKLQEAVLRCSSKSSTKTRSELYLNDRVRARYLRHRPAAALLNASASQLSLGQALYLASILPPYAPVFGADGQVTPG
jgi:membrane peptidoglycan carboxypeptidase